MNKNTFRENLDRSGKMYRKEYLEKYYPEILDDVILFAKKYDLNDIPFKQRIYHWLNNIKEYKKCYCGKKVKFKNSNIGYYKFCSNKCMNSSQYVKEKRKQTNINKFGTKTPSENNKIREKIIKTNLEKYGTNSPLLNKEIKEKSIKTLKNNYGVDNPLKSNIIFDKVKKTNLFKYGFDNVKSVDFINEKIKKTMLDKYGVEYALQNEKIKKKARNKQLITLAEKVKEYYKEYNIVNIDNENKNYKMICDKGHIFEIDYTLLNSRRRTNTLICTVCNKIDKSISGLEIELRNFIKDNYNEKIIFNDKSIINKELDIYLPDLKLAFDFNGLYWHNELNKSKKFHLNKTELCEKNEVELIHIYEDNWIYKQNIVKSMILNKLGKTPNKIYARKTEIKEITDNKLVRVFLNENHIQGFVGSKIKLGLFYNNELVSLMTFGRKRTILNNKSRDYFDWELSRFCNKLNINVLGGASKLFKYFIKNYKPKEITTYADRSYSQGKMYEKLGFKYQSKTQPNYYYIIDKIRRYRFNFRKSALIKDGFDSNKTEHEIMLDRNIYRIYDSGNLKFIFCS